MTHTYECRLPLVEESTKARQANLLAVLALGVRDRARRAEETAAGHGSAAPAALVALHEFLGGASIDQLRQVVGLTPSGAVRLIDKLSVIGLVQRSPGRDGRTVAVTLTPRGHEAARRVLAARHAATETLLDKLNTAEREMLTPLLERLLRELTAARLGERASAQSPPGGWLCRLCDFSGCGRDEGACPVAAFVQRAPDNDPKQ